MMRRSSTTSLRNNAAAAPATSSTASNKGTPSSASSSSQPDPSSSSSASPGADAATTPLQQRSGSFRDRLSNAQQLAARDSINAAATKPANSSSSSSAASSGATATTSGAAKNTTNPGSAAALGNKKKPLPHHFSQEGDENSENSLHFNIVTGRVERHLLLRDQERASTTAQFCSTEERRMWKQCVSAAKEVIAIAAVSSSEMIPTATASASSSASASETLDESLCCIGAFFLQHSSAAVAAAVAANNKATSSSSAPPSRCTSPALKNNNSCNNRVTSISFPVPVAAASLSPAAPITCDTKKQKGKSAAAAAAAAASATPDATTAPNSVFVLKRCGTDKTNDEGADLGTTSSEEFFSLALAGAKLQTLASTLSGGDARRAAAPAGAAKAAVAAAAAARAPPPKTCDLDTTPLLDVGGQQDDEDEDDDAMIMKVSSLSVEKQQIAIPTIFASSSSSSDKNKSKKKTKTKNKSKQRKPGDEEDEEDVENPWRKPADASSAASSCPFQIQSHGWSSAQACGRTAPLSVTCLVRKAAAAGAGCELRHVGGGISSISSTCSIAAASRSAQDEALPLLKLTSNSSPVTVTWPTTTTSSPDLTAASAKNNNGKIAAQYPALVPNGLACTLSISVSNSNISTGGNSAHSPSLLPSSSAVYEGPLFNGVRHSTANRIGTLTLTRKRQQTASSPHSNNNAASSTNSGSDASDTDSNNFHHHPAAATGSHRSLLPAELRAFSQVKYVGRWIKDRFRGAGAMTVEWDVDSTGAGSGCVTIASPDWAGLNKVEDPADVVVRFGGGVKPDDLELRPSQQWTVGEEAAAVVTFGGAQTSSLQPPSHRLPYMSIVCCGKVLSTSAATAAAAAGGGGGGGGRGDTKTTTTTTTSSSCYHTFKCSVLPQLRALPRDGVDLDGAAAAGGSKRIFSTAHKSGFPRCNNTNNNSSSGQDDNNRINDNEAGATLGSFLHSRASTPALMSSGAAAAAGGGGGSSGMSANGGGGSDIFSVPKLLLSLACADTIQMLFANVELLGLAGSSSSNNNSKNHKPPAVLAQIYEALLASQAGRWGFLSELVRIIRDEYVEPKKLELAQCTAEMAAAEKKRVAARKAHAAAKADADSLGEELAAMKKLVSGNSSSSDKKDNNNNNGNSNGGDDGNDEDDDDNEQQQHQHIVEQLGVDTVQAQLALFEQKERNKITLDDELRQVQKRLKSLDEDIDALQRERDHSADTKRALAAKKSEAIAEKKKTNAQYDAARQKLDALTAEKAALEINVFRSVMEPEGRESILKEFSASFSGSSSGSSSSSLFDLLCKQMDSVTSSLDKQRAAAVDATQTARAALEAMSDAKDRARQEIRETPDESSLLVAFQSAEAQSEMVLSRIRSMQHQAAADGVDAMTDEAAVRSKHAATMANFSKRLADIRENIRSMTDKEATLVGEVGEFEKKQQQQQRLLTSSADVKSSGALRNNNSSGGGGGGGGAAAATASLQNEYFGADSASDDPKRKQFASLRQDLKIAKAEIKELKYSLRGPALLILDSSQLPGCSNELLRALLGESKGLQKSAAEVAAAAADSRHHLSPFSPPVKVGAASSSFALSSPLPDIKTSLRDKDTKTRALQQAITQLDYHISDLRAKAQRVRLLESKLQVALDTASHNNNRGAPIAVRSATVSATVGAARNMVQKTGSGGNNNNTNNNNNFNKFATPTALSSSSSFASSAPTAIGGAGGPSSSPSSSAAGLGSNRSFSASFSSSTPTQQAKLNLPALNKR